MNKITLQCWRLCNAFLRYVLTSTRLTITICAMLCFLGQDVIVQKVISTAIALGCLALLHSLLEQNNEPISHHEPKRHTSDNEKLNQPGTERPSFDQSEQAMSPRSGEIFGVTPDCKRIGAQQEVYNLLKLSEKNVNVIKYIDHDESRFRGGHKRRNGIESRRETKTASYRAVRTRKSRYVLTSISYNHKCEKAETPTPLSTPPRSYSATSTCSSPSPCSQYGNNHLKIHPLSTDAEKRYKHNESDNPSYVYALDLQLKRDDLSNKFRSNNYNNPILLENQKSCENGWKERTFQTNQTGGNNQVALTTGFISPEDWLLHRQKSKTQTFRTHLAKRPKGDERRQLQLVARRLYKGLSLEKRLRFVSRRIYCKVVFNRFKLRKKINAGLCRFQALWRGNQCRTRRAKLLLIREWIKRKHSQSKKHALFHFVCIHITKKQVFQAIKSNSVDRKNAGSHISEFIQRWLERSKRLEQSKLEKCRKRRQQRDKYLRFRFLLFSTLSRNELDSNTLTNELKRWVSRVLAQIDCECRVIPPSDLSFEKGKLFFSLEFSFGRMSGSRLEPRTTNMAKKAAHRFGPLVMERLIRRPQQLHVLKRWVNRVFVYRRHRNAFYCARIRMFAATYLIQVAIKCRFANMLLAAKSRYFYGICNCVELIHLGTRIRAAIILQATWKYTQAFRYWRRYISVCKIRIVVLADLSKKCKEHIRIKGLHHLVNEFQSAWLTSKIPVSHRSKISAVLIQKNLSGWR